MRFFSVSDQIDFLWYILKGCASECGMHKKLRLGPDANKRFEVKKKPEIVNIEGTIATSEQVVVQKGLTERPEYGEY